jgi:hypothetical protein
MIAPVDKAAEADAAADGSRLRSSGEFDGDREGVVVIEDSTVEGKFDGVADALEPHGAPTDPVTIVLHEFVEQTNMFEMNVR